MLTKAIDQAERTLALVDQYSTTDLSNGIAIMRAASGIESWVSMATEAGPMGEQDEQEYAYEILARCTDVLLLVAG